MVEFDQEKFNEFWHKTEVIREYRQVLFTFGDIKLPYVFLAEHSTYSDRAIVCRGMIHIQKPSIILPGRYHGPEFGDGFEELAGSLPRDAAIMVRSMGLPFSQITNRPIVKEGVEYGSLQAVIDRFQAGLDKDEDTDTGLIKGLAGGAQISLMRYAVALMAKSAPENVKQFMDHLRRGRGEPIRPNERITDEDIDKLFE